MPLTISMTDDEASVLDKATKGKKLEINVRGRSLTITRNNIIPIRQAVNDFKMSKLSLKTKTIVHLEACYHAQALIKKIDGVAGQFGPMPEYDDILNPPEETTETEATENSELKEFDWGKDMGEEILPESDEENDSDD